jgi:hypothetical protein
MAARSSIAVVKIPLSHEGASSVIKIAIPIEIGAARRMAIKVLIKVPTIIGRAPKLSLTGSHSVEVRKFITPKF